MGLLGMVSTGVLAVGITFAGPIQAVVICLMALTGVTFGCLRALYPTLASENSTPGQRGLTLSVVSLYWAVAMLLSPLVFGFIADATSISLAMRLYGVIAAVGWLGLTPGFLVQQERRTNHLTPQRVLTPSSALGTGFRA